MLGYPIRRFSEPLDSLAVADHAEFLGLPPEQVEPVTISNLHSFVKTVRSSAPKENRALIRAFDGSS